MEKVTSKTFYNFRYVSDPHLSPDGSRVAFMVKRVNPSKNGYDSDLYVYENGEYQLSSLERVTGGDYNLTAWCDKPENEGGRIRVIIAR